MERRLTNEQWRTVLDLSDAAVDLPPQARRAFLDSSGATAEIIEQALLLIADFGPQAETPDRVGSVVGRFVITEYCGSGGVGDVYRAKDTELDRTVALKFLRPTALEQSGAVDRFIREARTVSALNHSNIVTVHEVLRSGSEVAIVMEFVEGRSLRTLCGSHLPIKEVMAIGRQIALALAAAHQRSIVHRDIKPENAILRPDGSIKVLDFGLATSLSTRRDGDSTISASHLFAGTWRYMSPEQFRGEAVTAAADIFSLGLVLCELATGCSPLADLPSLSSSTDLSGPVSFPTPSDNAIPHRLRTLVRPMLAELPLKRPSAAAVADRLADMEQAFSNKSRRSLVPAALLAALVALCAFTYFFLRNETSGTLLASAISVEPGYKYALDLTSTGDRVAYAWEREDAPSQIYVQSIDKRTGTASDPVRLTQSHMAEDLPAWSPDGKEIAYTRQQKNSWVIVLRDLATGHERVLTSFEGRSLSWTIDGQWLLCATGPYLSHSVVLISPSTGAIHRLTMSGAEVSDDRPISTPDERSVIFARFFSDSMSRLATVPLRPYDSAFSQLSFISWPDFHARLFRNPVYSKNGRDLFFIGQVDGIRRVYRSHSGQTPILLASLGERIDDVAIARQRNRMVFSRNLDDTNIWSLQLKPRGSSYVGKTTRIIASSRFDQRPAVSPDGSRIAFESYRSGYPEIWLFNPITGSASQLASMRSLSGSPNWSPDGRWVVFDARVNGSSSLFRVAAAGGQPQRLTTSSGFADLLPVVSPDGQWIYFASNRSGHFQVWRIPFDGGTPSLQIGAESTAPQLSTDGRFLYYLEKFWVPSTLWRKDLRTGKTSAVADMVTFRGYVVGKDAVYFSRNVGTNLKLYSAALDGHHTRSLATMSANTVGGFSIDKNEDTLYLAQLDSSGDDLMLVNSF